MADNTGETTEPPVARPKLRVWATVGEAYAIWFANLGLWLKLMSLPAVATIAAILILRNITFSSDVEFEKIAVDLLMPILIFAIAVPMITAWHRLILRGGEQLTGKYRVGQCELRYIKISVLIWVAIPVVYGILSAIAINIYPLITQFVWQEFDAWLGSWLLGPWVLFPLMYMTIAGAFSIFGLSFPAAAVGEPLSFRQSARVTWGNRWRLILISTAASLPIGVFNYLVMYLIIDSGADFAPYVQEAVDEFQYLLYLPPTVGFVSIAYRELVQKPEAVRAS
jgi:hypothetical protein